MSDELLTAVNELTRVVQSLETALTQYPKREEVEDRFATKHESRTRAKKYLATGLALVLVAFVSSIVVTGTIVSTCFISASARAGNAPSGCRMFPGYIEAQAENQKNLKNFRMLLEQPEKNSKRLDRLEKKLGLPPITEDDK